MDFPESTNDQKMTRNAIFPSFMGYGMGYYEGL